MANDEYITLYNMSGLLSYDSMTIEFGEKQTTVAFYQNGELVLSQEFELDVRSAETISLCGLDGRIEVRGQV